MQAEDSVSSRTAVDASADARDHLRALLIIRAVVILDVVIAPLAIVSSFIAPSSSYGTSASGLLFLVGTLVQLALAALVGLRRPSNRVGWLLLGAVTTNLVDSALLQPFVAIAVAHRATIPGGDLVGAFEGGAWILYVLPLAVLMPLVFPTGTLPSRRWRPVVWMAVVGSAAAFLGGAFVSNSDPSSFLPGVHAIKLPEPVPSIAGFSKIGVLILVVGVFAGIAALVLRYRRGSADERHQVKWLIAAVTLYLVGDASGLVPTVIGHPIAWLQDVAVAGLALIPVAAAIAVLKYRLYDIDLVISRALVYGSLALFITAVYVAIVVGVGTLVGSGNRPSLVLSILATAVVAVAFQPLRERLQKVANRLVYGKRATPYEVLSEFSARVAESFGGEQVLPRMARVLADGTGAQSATVWLRSGSTLRPAAAWPAATNGDAPLPIPLTGQLVPAIPNTDRAVPVRHQGELLGALAITKRTGETLTPIEEKLLGDLAHQAGLVLRNVGLTADLQARLEDLRASRQRLVAAQDQERRRLERNLHDGAQQHLVAIKVKLGLAEMLTARDPERAKSLVTELKADADEALETLRALARGIYPPLLADQGLVVALRGQAAKATLPVTVHEKGIARYDQEVEAAVYFCCLEALQNVQKYAGAEQASIHLSHLLDGDLRFEVRDDGAGFDPATTARGSGLQNIEDRLNALGGSLLIERRPGGGTIVAGVVAASPAVRVLERVG
ncbi:MAG: histidine kinase [Candidatus Dormibacteria bacterium]